MLYYFRYDTWYKTGKYSYALKNEKLMMFTVIRYVTAYSFHISGGYFKDL